MNLTFRKLQSPKDTIKQCQRLQPNRMQCPKAADFECTDDSQDPPLIEQFCTFHKICKENNISLTERTEEYDESSKFEPKPSSTS